MAATIAFAKRLNPTYASFHVVSPYRGTRLFEMSGSAELFPEAFSKEHDLAFLEFIASRAFREFYLRPTVVWSRLRTLTPRLWHRQLALFWDFVRPARS
jgi:hypothetical protein